MWPFRIITVVVVLLCYVTVGAACTQAQQEQTELPLEEEILALVDEARVTNGLSALARTDTMDILALEHSQDMERTGTVSHDGFEERASTIERLLGSSYVGENCAMGYKSAKAFVDAWLDSPGHRANIMNPSYHRTGIGYYKGYATQIFCD